MIALAIIFIVLLLSAAALFVLPALRHPQHSDEPSRDQLNTLFFERRLDELADEEAQGTVSEREVHIEELQQNLLADVPVPTPVDARRMKSVVLLPGVVLLLVVTLGFYAWTGGAGQWLGWQRTVDEMPALRARIMDPHARQLAPDELANFAIGLRASLQNQPENLQDWLILGRLGVVLNDAPMATQAFERAYQLAPKDPAVKMDYAEVLARSNDPGDNQAGNQLLTAIVKQQPDNVQALNLLAWSDYQLNNYPQAIALWQHLLSLLPAGDAHADDIRRAIDQAKGQSGQDAARLHVSVTLAPGVTARLPAEGTLYISVTDGKSPVPVAVKPLPLSRFPLSLTLDDSNAMMPERLLSSQQQVKVRVRLSRDGSAQPEAGDWFGESALQDFNGNGQVAVQIDRQLP